MKILYRNFLPLLSQFRGKVPLDVIALGEFWNKNCLVKPLVANDTFVGYQIGEVEDSESLNRRINQELLHNLKTSFNKRELKELCFRLNINHEELDDDTMHLSLISACERKGITAELLKIIKGERPTLDWSVVPEFQEADAVAIIVSASRRPFEDAAEHMSKLTNSCMFYLFTNDLTQSADKNLLLSVDEGWDSHVQAFSQFCGKIPLNKPTHFFFAGPAQLAFMFGCAFGTVHTGHHVYHYQPWEADNNKYIQVGTISRNWKI